MYLKAIALVIILMSGIGFQAGAVHGDNGSVVFGNAPFINVTLPDNVGYNLTYLGLVYVPGPGFTQPAANYFSTDNWSNSFSSNGNMSYHSTFQIGQTGMGMMDDHYSQAGNSLSVSIFINVTPVKTGNSANQTPGNYNVTDFANYTYYRITTWISATSAATPSSGGKLVLVVSFGGREDGSQISGSKFMGIGMMSENERAQHFNGYLLNNSRYPALFWWNNTYNLNGNNETFNQSYSNVYSDMFESGQVNFEFNLSGSSSVIFQDPYLATAGIGITTLPPSTITLAAINFLLEHTELLAGGAAIGSVLIAIPYFAYRRRKLI
ncbi:MAG: hypothetical protein ACYCT2_02560 [Thermoplasmataceae archaeon]